MIPVTRSEINSQLKNAFTHAKVRLSRRARMLYLSVLNRVGEDRFRSGEKRIDLVTRQIFLSRFLNYESKVFRSGLQKLCKEKGFMNRVSDSVGKVKIDCVMLIEGLKKSKIWERLESEWKRREAIRVFALGVL